MPQELSQLGAMSLARDGNLNNYSPSYPNPDWVWDTVSPFNWNKSFPYQLIVVEASRVDSKNGKNKPTTGYTPSLEFATFTLPIAPQEMNISTPSAVHLSATLGGVIEEHNAAPFRTITMSGTTGVTPLRGRAAVLGARGSLKAIFAGTIGKAEKIASDFGKLIGGTNSNLNLISDTPDVGTDEFLQSTGYLQFQMLQRFWESYLHAKKSKPTLRLALCIWKDSSVFLVTPLDLTLRRNASSPLEYTFTLQFKAFKRVHLNQDSPDAFEGYTPLPDDISIYQNVLNRVQAARKVLQDAQDVVRAAQIDVQALIEVSREVVYFAKDALGVATTLADLPANIIGSASDAIQEGKDTFLQIQSFLRAGGNDTNPVLSKDLTSTIQQYNIPETGRGSATNTQTIAFNGAIAKLLADPAKNFTFFNSIAVAQLRLSSATTKLVATERTRVRSLTRLDFEQRRDTLVQSAADFADNVGAGSSTFNAIYGRKVPTSTRIPTLRDYEIMYQLNELVACANYFVASGRINRVQTNSMDYVAGLASKSGIAFTVPRSKFVVPFPYASTLPQLANTYLGNAARWMEIATLNGLRAPYIDEVGFDLPLLVQGSSAQVQVADTSNIVVGQSVWVTSNAVIRTKRHVTDIRRITATNFIVTLDGDTTLSLYKPADQASLHAYLPNTVNSQMLVYIPSNLELNGVDLQTKSIPGINIFDNLLLIAGTDVLLTPGGDWAIGPDGDCRVAQGLTNLIQRARIALLTPQGSMILHPTFGLPIKIGESTADSSARDLLAAAKNLFSGDSSFTGVNSASVVKNGPTSFLSIGIGVRGVSDLIPITVAIKQ